jgi:RNA polymerase sigma factor (sigma-70 family)
VRAFARQTHLGPFENDVARLHASSYGWAMACCGRNADEASEVLQQAYFKVFSGRATFDGRSSLRTWLFGVIRLTALESRRFRVLRWLRASPEPDGVEGAEAATDEPSPSASLADRERAAAIEAALAILPPRQRDVLHLAFYEGLTLREAAEVMGISLGAASQHYERGKARLLPLLTEKGIS